MPNSQDTANSFMTGGRADQTPAPWSAELSHCQDPQIATVPDFDLEGRTKVVPAGVDYDEMPDRKNPRSVSDQTTPKDAQGK